MLDEESQRINSLEDNEFNILNVFEVYRVYQDIYVENLVPLLTVGKDCKLIVGQFSSKDKAKAFIRKRYLTCINTILKVIEKFEAVILNSKYREEFLDYIKDLRENFLFYIEEFKNVNFEEEYITDTEYCNYALELIYFINNTDDLRKDYIGYIPNYLVISSKEYYLTKDKVINLSHPENNPCIKCDPTLSLRWERLLLEDINCQIHPIDLINLWEECYLNFP